MKKLKSLELDWENGYLKDAEGWYEDGKQYHFVNSYIHSVNDEPSINFFGDEHWYKQGKSHRENGPASVFSDGKKEWWLNGMNYSEEQFMKWQIENNKHPLQELPKNNNNKKMKV